MPRRATQQEPDVQAAKGRKPHSAPPAPTKRSQLTLSQLAAYDDILTDALVDHTFYWTTIPKNRPSYHPSRGVKETEITKIIQSHVVVQTDVALAERKLLETEGLKRFHNSLKTEREKDDFKRHMRRYLNSYLPDCPFEVNSTNRYTIITHEASITARRPIKRNEVIKYLCGIQVTITPEEEREISRRKKDFSIVVSSRNKCTSLFMGPARFANHDCGANARLQTTGYGGMEVVATKRIDVDEEITVSYGDSYFGEDNCDCLCRTCEDSRANGWKRAGDGSAANPGLERGIEDSNDVAAVATAAQPYSLRRRRRDGSTGAGSRSESGTPDIRPRVMKRRALKMLLGGDRATTADLAACEPLNSLLKRTVDVAGLTTPPVTPTKKHKKEHRTIPAVPLPGIPRSSTENEDEGLRSELSSSSSSLTHSETSVGDAAILTDATTPEEEERPDPVIHSPRPTHIRRSIQVLKEEAHMDEVAVLQVPVVDAPSVAVTPPRRTLSSIMAVSSVVNGLSSGYTTVRAYLDIMGDPSAEETVEITAEYAKELETANNSPAQHVEAAAADDPTQPIEVVGPPTMGIMTESNDLPTPSTPASTTQAPLPTPTSKARGRGHRRAHASSISSLASADMRNPTQSAAIRTRTPGDYSLNPILLSEPHMAWVRCSNCNGSFVQPNAYYTKSSCPRCERHSMLYGFVWPKTQADDSDDDEARVMDPRLVHRFLDPTEEAKARGKKLSPWLVKRAEREMKEEGETTTGKGCGIWYARKKHTGEADGRQKAIAKPKRRTTITAKNPSLRSKAPQKTPAKRRGLQRSAMETTATLKKERARREGDKKKKTFPSRTQPARLRGPLDKSNLKPFPNLFRLASEKPRGEEFGKAESNSKVDWYDFPGDELASEARTSLHAASARGPVEVRRSGRATAPSVKIGSRT